MKLLSIDSEHNGLFLKNDEWASIDSLQKEDIVGLIQAAAANHIEVDELTEERYIKHPASKTIYEKLSRCIFRRLIESSMSWNESMGSKSPRRPRLKLRNKESRGGLQKLLYPALPLPI